MDESFEAAAHEETKMTAIEDAPPVVVERTERHPHSRIPVPEVRHADHDGSAGAQSGPDIVEDPLRGVHVFEHVGRDHHVVAVTDLGRDALLQVADHE